MFYALYDDFERLSLYLGDEFFTNVTGDYIKNFLIRKIG